ncbi:MAG: hypothetical protein AAFX87_31725 [Bacteroidota bacterium]
MNYIPSPIEFKFHFIYSATANRSGRMQYHKIKLGEYKERISRTEFIRTFNTSKILAIKPLPTHPDSPVFQLEFYV